MSNINFDNPLLLCIIIPLLALVSVPFFIAVRKDNANLHNVLSLVLHVIACACFTLAISGMSYEKVVTKTQVYVLADISYSAEHNLDDVQNSVDKIAQKLPRNSQIGVICFGRNYIKLSDLGEPVPDIKSASQVDRTATDISSALRYAGTLFDDGVIKRIVVVTDGAETVSSNNLIKVVSALGDKGVRVDAVFIDDNLADDISEIQLDAADATPSTYLGKEEDAEVLVRVNCGLNPDGSQIERVDGYVSLFLDGELLVKKTATLYNGLNTINLPLSTDEAGVFEYEVKVEPVDSSADTSPHNNVYKFTQRVTDERKVLFIGGNNADLEAGRTIYGVEDADYISDPSKVPLGVEDMCEYDEIALCNFDVRTLSASDMFVTSLATLVDDYGKTLTTYGNTFIQEDDPDDKNSPLKKLADLLPVRIGNYDQDKRLIAIVLDVSLSMNFTSRLAVAKNAAIEIIKSLSATDTVMVVGFSGVVKEFMPPTALTATKVIIETINATEVENGTNLSAALKHTYDLMPRRYHDRQVIIISDGLDPSADRANAKAKAAEMSADNIAVSALGIYPEEADSDFLSDLVYNASAKAGVFYKSITHESQAQGIISEITAEKKQIETVGDFEVTITRPDDEAADGVTDIDNVGGFWYNQAKGTAKTVLTAKYFRDKVTSFDVPIYAYWNGGGKGKVVSFLSDISSDWTADWTVGGGAKFLSNIPSATLPDERINTPFILQTEGSGNSTTLRVYASESLSSGGTFNALLRTPDGLVYEKTLAYDSDGYVATFTTDAPGSYKVHLEYDFNSLHYESDAEFAVSYYAEYDAFKTYGKSQLYRLLSENGSILELDEVSELDNSGASYTVYTFSFKLPLMIICLILLVIDIIIRQIKWQDLKSFFEGLKRRRR
ncbi:MAG: VWA domain-containing protein [Bacteroides sp.]|nr:VWA domain-containing protein [Bacillota bacterium]MCM1393999.1 VWA domain-containing protein [[Eubacterium] siraeum]MCM1455654.1 VWA domain-containing protein [Bacteroides sp.]